MMKKSLIILSALCGLSSCQESFDERCTREAREYTEKQCPRRMDAYTVMDSLTYDTPSRTLHYFYTLEGLLDNDSVTSAEFQDALKDLLHKYIMNSVDLKTYKEKGLNFCYHYYSRSTGKERCKALFTPTDYGKAPHTGNKD